MIYRIPRPYEQLFEEPKKKESPVETENNEEANVVAEIKTPTEETKKDDQPDRKKDIIFQMQMLFARMQYSSVSSVSTSGLTTSFGWDKCVTHSM
jgi:hypothetical protein